MISAISEDPSSFKVSILPRNKCIGIVLILGLCRDSPYCYLNEVSVIEILNRFSSYVLINLY